MSTSTGTDDSFFAPIVEWSISAMEQVGPIGAAVAVFLDNIFPPIPSEVVLPLAGIAASNGAFPLWSALLWATIGSLASALVWYGLAVWLGAARLRRIVDRVPLMKGEDVDLCVEWFLRHGRKAVFFGRMVPGIRSLISIPAGFTRMHLAWFIGLTTAGSLLWNSIFIVAGYVLGEAWAVLEPFTRVFEILVVVVLLGLGTTFLVVRIRGLVRERRALRETQSSST